MESNNIQTLIHQTVSSMLPRWHDEKICLVMKLYMSWSYYPENSEQPERFHKLWQVVFYRINNYTKVFVRNITHENDFYPNKIEDTGFKLFNLTSDHDTCWTTDGLKFVWKTFLDAWKHFEEKEIEGRDISPNIHFGINQGNPHYREVEFNKSHWRKRNIRRPDDYNKLWEIRFGRKIEMHEISKFMPDRNN